MTSLLNGQAVKVWLASTSVTAMRGSARLSMRAQVAPEKPPPTTTTRPPAFCASAGIGSSAAAAPAAAVLRTSRRLWDTVMVASLILLCAIPIRDGLDLVVGEALGDTVHHGRGALARAERLHGGDDLRRRAADQPVGRRLDRARHRMAAGAGRPAGRRIGRQCSPKCGAAERPRHEDEPNRGMLHDHAGTSRKSGTGKLGTA